VFLVYHDGWWKGGNENTHDPNAEEWFGFIEFSGLHDRYGTMRPVWAAYENYNRAIIINPKNESVYDGEIPLEFFLTEEVSSYALYIEDRLLLSDQVNNIYHTDAFLPETNDLVRDLKLNFHFFDTNDDILKSESISVLYTKNYLELPKVEIDVFPKNLVPGSRNFLSMQVTVDSLFIIEDNKIDYVCHPHIGFDQGMAKSEIMTIKDNSWFYLDDFDIPVETKVATFAAGFTIKHGDFKKRITGQQILLYGDWADPIAAPELITGSKLLSHDLVRKKSGVKLDQNFPNPFNPETRIAFDLPRSEHVIMEVFNITGQKVQTVVDNSLAAGSHEVQFYASDLPSGLYYYSITAGKFRQVKKMVVLR